MSVALSERAALGSGDTFEVVVAQDTIDPALGVEHRAIEPVARRTAHRDRPAHDETAGETPVVAEVLGLVARFASALFEGVGGIGTYACMTLVNTNG